MKKSEFASLVYVLIYNIFSSIRSFVIITSEPFVLYIMIPILHCRTHGTIKRIKYQNCRPTVAFTKVQSLHTAS